MSHLIAGSEYGHCTGKFSSSHVKIVCDYAKQIKQMKFYHFPNTSFRKQYSHQGGNFTMYGDCASIPKGGRLGNKRDVQMNSEELILRCSAQHFLQLVRSERNKE